MNKLIIISLALILASGLLMAQKFEGKHCDEPGMGKQMNPAMPMLKNQGMMECMDELKLTDAQKKKFDELRTAFQKTENSLAAEIENLKIDMHTAIKAENFKQAKELNKQISAKETALQDARLDFMAARMKELSPEQKAIMKKNMKPMLMQGKDMKQDCKGQGMMQMHGMGNCGDCNEHGTMQMKSKNQDDCKQCPDCQEKDNKTPAPKDNMPKNK